MLEFVQTVHGLETRCPISPLDSVVYQHPITAAWSAQVSRFADDAYTACAHVPVSEDAAAVIQHNLPGTRHIVVEARTGGPFLPPDDVLQVVNLGRGQQIGAGEHMSPPFKPGQPPANALARRRVETHPRHVLQGSSQFPGG